MRRSGKARNFWGCLLLGTLTLGIYFLVYAFMVFWEVDQETGRRHHGKLFLQAILLAILQTFIVALPFLRAMLSFSMQVDVVLGMLSSVVLGAYFWIEVGQLNQAMRSLNLVDMPRFALPAVLAVDLLFTLFMPKEVLLGLKLLLLIPYLTVFWALQARLNAFWSAHNARLTPPPALPGPQPVPG